MKNLFVTTRATDDPLADPGEPRDTYKDARKQFHGKTPKMMLSFAQWREDIGDYVEANATYRDVIADDPNNVEARLGIARLQYKTGQKQDALSVLSSTAKQHPESTQAWVEYGRFYSDQGQWNEAVEKFKTAVRTAPRDRRANYELGIALARLDRLEEAHQCLAIANGESAGFYNIGFVLSEQGRNREAADWLQRALRSNPNSKTQKSATQLLVNLTTDPTEGMIAKSSTAHHSYVNRDRTTYQKLTERPDSNGMFQPNGTPSIVPSSATLPQYEGPGNVQTANLQRTLNSFEPQQSPGPQNWNGPSMVPDAPVVQSSTGSTSPNHVDPPMWHGSK